MEKAYFSDTDELLSAFWRTGCRDASSADIPCGDWINENGEIFDGRKHEFLEQFFPEGISLADGSFSIERNIGTSRGKQKIWYVLKK